jgi:lipopolysaccharide transport system permease protein
MSPADAFALAMVPMRERRWGEASALWQAYREQYKGHFAPWLQGAISYLRQGQYTQAEALLAHVREHFKQHPESWLVSAESMRLQNDKALEQSYLQGGIEHAKPSWELYYRLAALALSQENYQLADEYNLQARQLNGEKTETWTQYGEIAEKQNDWEEAIKRWSAAAEQLTGFNRAYTHIAAIYKLQGNAALSRRYRLAAQYGAELLKDNVSRSSSGPLNPQSKNSLRHTLQLVNTKALLNLKSESARTHLNYAWVVIEPLMHLVIYYFLFGRLLNAGVENYGLFLLSGLVPWMWFAKSVATSANSIVSGQSLMLNSNVRPEFFPMVSVVQATYKQLPALLALLMLGIATDDKSLSWSLLYLPLIILCQFFLTLAVAMLVAAIIPFVRDLMNLITTGLTLLMFMSGVVYNYQSLPGGIGHWVQYNPLTLMIAAYRDVIMQGHSPSVSGLGYVMSFTLFLALINIIFYKKQQRNFVRKGMS